MTPLAFLAKIFIARRGLLPLVVVLALLSSGCAMKAYEGPELPRSEIAVLHGVDSHGVVLGIFMYLPVPEDRHRTSIYEIDGKSVPAHAQFDTDFRNAPEGQPERIHILPGQHTARVSYERRPNVTLCGFPSCIRNYYTRDLSIDFAVEAGHEYRIPVERRDERNWIWVEDITSGKVVAGEKPPDDKSEGKNPAKPSEPGFPR